VVAFGVGFITLLLIFTELNTAVAGSSSVTLFKRGSRADVVQEASAAVGSDEEKADAARQGGAPEPDNGETEEALADGPKMEDTFTWQHLNYTVPVSGGKRQLLDDISGYVVPGKLTALMGESGAGKVSRHPFG
jgi:ATP-binding cassette subfamily G (WHITE) protein 2 (SNQ2)